MKYHVRIAFGLGVLTILSGSVLGWTSEAVAGGMMVLGGCVLVAACCLGPVPSRLAQPGELLEEQLEEPTKLLDPSMFPRS